MFNNEVYFLKSFKQKVKHVFFEVEIFSINKKEKLL
jgi:hypothetical protein